MKPQSNVKVFIKAKQYLDAFKRSGLGNELDFDKSIGVANDLYYDSHLASDSELSVKINFFYTIRGGIPIGAYKEFFIIDEKLFDYGKIKYEFYND